VSERASEEVGRRVTASPDLLAHGTQPATHTRREERPRLEEREHGHGTMAWLATAPQRPYVGVTREVKVRVCMCGSDTRV